MIKVEAVDSWYVLLAGKDTALAKSPGFSMNLGDWCSLLQYQDILGIAVLSLRSPTHPPTPTPLLVICQ